MTPAFCPACGGPCVAEYATINGTRLRLEGWQILCRACGYSGPVEQTERRAIERHNKISQNCGATG